MRRKTVLSMGCGLVAFSSGIPVVAAAQDGAEVEVEQQIVASAIREKGFTCEKMSHMERSREDVAEGQTVWIAQCESGSYKVSFHGDTGASVSRLP